MSKYQAVIGMEVHAQLLTKSKMFCGCSADYADAPPNSHTCPVCLAMPGSLPVINQAAVEATIRTGLALSCEIASFSVFARKNYNYPDLPKGYQISQYELPLCHDGWLEIEDDQGEPKRIRIRRAHLEEDTGKLLHVRNGATQYSLVDLNRAGVPLLEIVTEADIASADEAHRYLTELRSILRYLGVSSGDMEKGALRCEANISVRTAEQAARGEYGVKVEVKNLNSFRAVRNSIAYEIDRHVELLERGEQIQQVTMGWDEARGRTVVQRTKESAHDYRYFPEPDLPPLEIKREGVKALSKTLPELPGARRQRFVEQYQLASTDADVLTAERTVADYFEQTVEAYGGDARTVANWTSGEVFRLMNLDGVGIEALRFSPQELAALLKLVDNGAVNPNTGKRVLEEMYRTGKRAREIIEAQGLAQVSDTDALAGAVRKVLQANPAEVQKYRDGKTAVVGWLMGQVMRETRGKANPGVVRELLEKELDGDGAG